jgi:hypothetical protein
MGYREEQQVVLREVQQRGHGDAQQLEGGELRAHRLEELSQGFRLGIYNAQTNEEFQQLVAIYTMK